MIRTVITANESSIHLPIPDDYIGKQVEVIAFTVEEGAQSSVKGDKTISFDAIQLDTKSYKFNRDEANER